MHIHVLYIIGKGKALPSQLYDFCTVIVFNIIIFITKIKIHVFENYMVIYTDRKIDEIGVTLE